MFPLIVRPLRTQEWCRKLSLQGLRDATSPYGYGGPVRWGEPDQFAEGDFYRQLRAWLVQNDVIAAFTRLSLFDDLACAPPVDEWHLRVANSNIVRSLEISPDEVWREYAHKVRKNVNRARSNALRCEIDPTTARMSEFLEIYSDTMTRRDAHESYRFDHAFFEKITSIPGGFVFAHVWRESDLISTELVLRSRSHIYSFLGGTLSEHFGLRPNDLLKHEVIHWGIDHGMKSFVLGGGYTPNDGIFRYKESFAPQGTLPFRVATLTTGADHVAELCAERERWEAANGRTWAPRTEHFPPYRG